VILREPRKRTPHSQQQSDAFRIGSHVCMLQTHAPHARASTCRLPAWSRAPSARLDTGTPFSHPLIPPNPSEHARYRVDTTTSDGLPSSTTCRLSASTKRRMMEPNSTQRTANTISTSKTCGRQERTSCNTPSFPQHVFVRRLRHIIHTCLKEWGHLGIPNLWPTRALYQCLHGSWSLLFDV
jgi:hypothetical protein